MNAKGITLTLMLFIVLIFSVPVFSQQASAEFIAQHDPAQLESGEQIKEGIQDLFLLNKRLYLVNIWSGLQVLDVSNVRKPKELGFYTPENRAFNVFVDDHYAYLSQKRGGVYLLDVTNPAKIKKVGQIKTKGDAYYVLAAYPYVYVAEEKQCLGVYDITDISNPVEVGRFKGEGWAWSLFLDGEVLYVGAKNGGLGILDVSNPANPRLLGKYVDVKFTKSIFVDQGVAYIAEGPEGLVIVDVSNAAKPKLLSTIKIEGWANHVFKTGSTLFLSNDKGKHLEIIDVSDPSNPIVGGAYESEYRIYAAIKSGIYVYVAADNKTLVLRYNHPPTIAPIADQTVDENQQLLIQPIASDLDEDPLYFSVQNLTPGAIFDTLSGMISWLPDFEQSGTYKDLEITVHERTESGLSSKSRFNIVVRHVNRLPELPEVAAYDVDENVPLMFVVPEGSDPDREDAGKLVYTVSGLPQGASFDGHSRQFSWTPTYEQSGTYPLTFTLDDQAGGVVTRETMITVAHVDRKPDLAELKPLFVDENAVLEFTLQGFDPDAEDQTSLSYQAANLPEGAVFDAATATFRWTPTYEQSGVYKDLQFVFTAGALSDTIFVDATVNHVNRPPVLNAVLDQQVDENSMLTFKVTGTDPDKEDLGKLLLSAENLPQGATFNADSGSFSWTPSFEQSGQYEGVTFQISDPSGLSDSKSITLQVNHVNRVPALAEISAKTVDENALLSFQLVGTDPDKEDAGKLVYTIETLPVGAVLEGNTFSWTPNYDQSGSYPLHFTVSDGRLSASQDMEVTVIHVNRPPVLDALAAQSVKENALLTFNITGSDPDQEDSGKYKYSVANMPQGATFDSSSLQFSWTPSFEQSGTYTIPFTVTDPSGLSDTKEATIAVEHVNRTPVFNALEAQTVDENQALMFSVIPATDPDVEDIDKLVYTARDLPQGAVFDAEALTLSWTPTFEQSGHYTVSFNVSDGAFNVVQPLEITVNHVNRPPQITQPEAQQVDENSAWNYSVVYSDPDAEDQGKLILSAENLPQGASFEPATGSFSWTPDYEQSGLYEGIVVKVADPSGAVDQKTFSLNVVHVNRPPQLEPIAAQALNENEQVLINLAASDADKEDSGKLVFSSVNLPQGAVLDAATGAFSWTPNFLQAGVYNLVFKVSDSGNLSAEQTVTITIADVNHKPVLTVPEAQQVKENEALQFKVQAKDEDSDNQLTLTAENVPTGATFNAADASLSWTPAFDQAGDYSVTYKLSDGTDEISAIVDIHVENVNRAPKISGPASASVMVDENVNLSYSGSDQDKDELTFNAGDLPAGATFDGKTFNWTPSEDQVGTFMVTITVSDGIDEAKTETGILVLPKPAPAPPDSASN